MSRDFWDTAAEFSLNLGLEWLKAQQEAEVEIDKTTMANVIAVLSIDGATRVTDLAGSAGRMSVDEFVAVVAVFYGEISWLAKTLTGVPVDPAAMSMDFTGACTNALQEMQRRHSQVTVTSALVKR